MARVLLLLSLAHIGCSSTDARLVARAHQSMGSELQVTLWTAEQPTTGKAFADAFAEVDRLDALLSVWKPGSDVLRVNAAAGQAPVAVSRETIEVVAGAHW